MYASSYCYIVEVSLFKNAAQTISRVSQNQSLCFSRHFQHAYMHAYASLLIKCDSYMSSMLFHHNLYCNSYWLIFSLRTKVYSVMTEATSLRCKCPRFTSLQAIWSITNFLYFYLLQNSNHNPCVCFFFNYFSIRLHFLWKSIWCDPLAKNLQYFNANILKILILQSYWYFDWL